MTHELPKTLKDVGLKATPARNYILDLFSVDCKPINAEYIHEKLKGKRVNQVTIYRTLASFELAGILKKVELQKGSVYYELTGHHHHHIICVDCGKTEGFEKCDIDVIAKNLLKKSSTFRTINQHSLELFGLCKNCS